MATVRINARAIRDEASFHGVFAEVLGFPDFYGHNMDAWIDCMSYVDDPSAGMSRVTAKSGEVLTLLVEGAEEFKQRCPGLWLKFLESAAFVNWRQVEQGRRPLLAVAACA